MFNYYSHEKQAVKKQLESYKPDIEQAAKNRDSLSNKYRNRINNSLMQINESLVTQSQRSKSPEVKKPELSVFRNSKAQSLMTSLIDSVPSKKKAFSLRPRRKSKEIQPNLRFKLTGSDRVKESIHNQRQVFDTSNDLRTLNNNYTFSESFRTTAGKSVYGYFHYKLHPKTFESIALNLHGSTRNASKREINQKNRDKALGIKEKETDKIALEDIIPISNNVLARYGIWRSRNRSQTPSFH